MNTNMLINSNANETLAKYLPRWFSDMKLINTYEAYEEYSYINIIIQVTRNHCFFNASHIARQLKDSSFMSSLMKTKQWYNNRINYADMMFKVKGEDTKSYKGYWFAWPLFSTFVDSLVPSSNVSFECNIPIKNNDPGYIYMCHPGSLINTNTYKFGKTFDWNKRVNDSKYGPDTELIYLIPVDDMKKEESKMLKYMNEIMTKDLKQATGTNNKGLQCEYYLVECNEQLSEAMQYFENRMKELNVKNEACTYIHQPKTLMEIVNGEQYKNKKRFLLSAIVEEYKICNKCMITQKDVIEQLKSTNKFKITNSRNKYYVKRI